MRRAQRGAFEAKLRPVNRKHVMHQDIGAVQQLMQALAIAGSGQIERHAQLAGIEINEHPAAFGVLDSGSKRTAKTDRVALRRLDLDYFRAQQAEQFGGESGGYALTTLDYLYPGEHSGLRALTTAHTGLRC